MSDKKPKKETNVLIAVRDAIEDCIHPNELGGLDCPNQQQLATLEAAYEDLCVWMEM